ncbi:MAG: MarC family protein [Azospirillaceae bacterium]
MLELFLTSFVTLFVVVDPPGNLPIFMSLTGGTARRHQLVMAVKGTAIATAILVAFALGGQEVLDLIGIGLPAFRIAGGLMLMVIAFEMVFERRGERRARTAERLDADQHGGEEEHDISVFPLAIPLLAGPGAITSVLLLAGGTEGIGGFSVVLLTVVVVMALSAALFAAAEPLSRVMGRTLTAIISRLFGILLSALAAQFVIDGIKAAFALG